MAVGTLKYVLNGFPQDHASYFDYFHHPYYGAIFNIFTLPFQYLFSNKSLLTGGWDYIAEVYAAKHVATVWFSSLNVVFLFKAFRRSDFSFSESFLYSLLLPSCLYFFGHSLMNPKDIPFATFFTISSYFIGRHFFDNLQNRDWKDAAKIGLWIGLCACIRLGGLVQLAHLVLFLIWADFFKIQTRDLKASLRFFLVSAVTALFVTYLGYPAAWRNPFVFIDAIKYLHKVTAYDGPVYFWGQLIPSHQPVWYYIPAWFLVKVPLILILALIGFYGLKIKDKKMNSFELIFFLQLTSLPLLAILSQAAIFNGLRHILFIFPAVVYLGSVFLQRAALRFPVVIYSLLAIHFLLTSADLALLRTHAYTYFNEPTRLFKAENNMEKDYWGESGRETAEKITELTASAPDAHVIVSYAPLYRPYLASSLIVQDTVDEKPFPPEARKKGFFFTTHLKRGSNGEFTECTLLHETQVHTFGGSPYTLNVIRKCLKADPWFQ